MMNSFEFFNYYLGWALVQTPDLLLFVYCYMRNVLKLNDHPKVGSREINQNASQNTNKSNIIIHDGTGAEAYSNHASRDKAIEDIGQIEEISKISNNLESQLNNLKAEFRQFKVEIIDALRKY